jgi:hypothetical protein
MRQRLRQLLTKIKKPPSRGIKDDPDQVMAVSFLMKPVINITTFSPCALSPAPFTYF